MGDFALFRPRSLVRLTAVAVALVVGNRRPPCVGGLPDAGAARPACPAPAEDGLYPMIFPVQGDNLLLGHVGRLPERL